ncbi:hypothetical protein MtrunA17_Chr3g0144011 [Medicago truncatula]|uniref:Transmembrane protein n=1 Tax=Medicago truncatula TaxID=3880 RepID=A0A396J457_MEDTR|nr:hypothetical protein MtrunA17_Chr3g0144011 [Medicago truncatula]
MEGLDLFVDVIEVLDCYLELLMMILLLIVRKMNFWKIRTLFLD